MHYISVEAEREGKDKVAHDLPPRANRIARFHSVPPIHSRPDEMNRNRMKMLCVVFSHRLPLISIRPLEGLLGTLALV